MEKRKGTGKKQRKGAKGTERTEKSVRNRLFFRGLLLAVMLFMCGLASCGKEKAEPNVPLQDLIVEYPLDNMVAYAANANGILYAANYDTEIGDYQLNRFSAQGELEESIRLPEYSMLEALTVSGDGETVYFTAQVKEYGISPCLVEYRRADGSLHVLCQFTFFDNIKQLAQIDDTFYILGISPNWQTQKAPSSGYSFSGERLVAYSPATDEMTQLGFAFPISMAVSETQTLVVSGYFDGYCLMEYDPQADSMKVLSKLDQYKFDKFAICNGGKSVIYSYSTNSRGLVLSDCDNLSVEAELFPDGSTMRVGVCYTGGRVYCSSFMGTLTSFPLSAVQRQNRELSFVTRDLGILISPYGCGYMMNRVELSDEKFTLKVLARDKDYDLCMGDTSENNAGNLRENGVFYPLNDVPGIKEYLERCYPYVREAATKDDGSIWMLPIGVDVYGFAANRAALEKNGLSLSSNMTWSDYLEFVRSASSEQRERFSSSVAFLERAFLLQYFSHYRTVGGELFADSVAALAGLRKMEHYGNVSGDDFIFEQDREPRWLNSPQMKEQLYGLDGIYVPLPKLSSDSKNVASCTFLAVNPDSDRLDEAVAYLTDLIAYLMKSDSSPFFSDWQGNDAFDATVRDTYANAEIAFAIDSDIYSDGFDEMLDGTLSVDEYVRRTQEKLSMYWGE